MIWICFCILCSLLSLLEAHKHCMQQIKWGNLFHTLNGMSSGISEACAHHYNKDKLCDPSQMLSQVELNTVLLDDIMNKAELIYKKNPNPEHFIHALQHTRRLLTHCGHHSHNVEHEPVVTCFNKLEAFIHNNMSHTDCIWEIVNATVKEILLRLEKRTFRKRR